MADPEGHLPSALTPQGDQDFFYLPPTPPAVAPTHPSEDLSEIGVDFPPLPQQEFAGATAPLPPLAPEEVYGHEEQFGNEERLYEPLDFDTELPPDLEAFYKAAMPPPPLPTPLPQPTAWPIINLAMTTTGGFKKNSPLHKWIVNRERDYATPSDPTQTRLVNAVCEILADPDAGSTFTWHSMPDNKSFVRVDISLWIGSPDARANWKKLEAPGGWQTGYNHVTSHTDNPRLVEHIGDPRVCMACKRATVIKQMSRQIEELVARIGMLEEELRNEREKGRPAKRRRKEPARTQESQVSGPTPRARGAGRGRRGFSGRRTMVPPDTQAAVPLDPALQLSDINLTSTTYPDAAPPGDTIFPPDIFPDGYTPWDYTE